MDRALESSDRVFLSSAIVAGVSAHALSGAASVRLALAAAACWLALGALVVAWTRDRACVLRWMDACLVTMRHGTAVLLLGALFNAVCLLAGRPLPVVQLAIVLAADVLMGVTFVRHAPLSAGQAAAAWILGMNGALAVLLWS